MSKKTDHAAHGPSWTEVILGAVLSAILGVAIGAALMVLKPVEVVKDLPKVEDRKRGVLYVIEGARGDTAKAKQALVKRKAFVEGQSVAVTEDELNSLLGATGAPAPAPAPAPKPAEKGKAGAPAAAPAAAVSTKPNARIRDGALQIGAPVTLDVAGLTHTVYVHARGHFEKRGDVFVYQPDELYLGGCPVQRLPFLAGYARDKFFAAQQIPEDITAAWRKLSGVAIEDKTLKLTQ